MDSDATLDGEVDHSFFDSDCERERARRRSRDGDPGQRSPSPPAEGAVARPLNQESSAGPRRLASAASSPATSVSRSSSSSSSSGEFARFRTRSPSDSSSSSGHDEAGDRTGPDRSPRTVPASRWLHRAGEAAQSDPASSSDSDVGSSVSGRASSSSTEKRPSSFSTAQWKTRPSAKTRKGRSHDLCRTKKRLEDTEGTVTDVTPLSSPECSPIHSMERCEEPKPKPCRKKNNKKQENVSQAIYSSLDPLSFDKEKGEGVQKTRRQKKPREAKPCNPNSTANSVESKRPDQRRGQKVLNDATDLNQLLKAMMHLEKKELRKIVSDFPEQRRRKNYTFSNEEAKRIDRENQRLLQELTRKATRPAVNKPKKVSAATVRVYHSTLNRQREQERIERENLAFLKRLEAVKPTVGLKRSTQLFDYQRQMSFMESYSQQSRPSTRGSMSRLSSRSSVHKTIHPLSN
ncbi:cilia- and flagella-associated protein 97 [Pristis pectinata]|uniref:cilia- and flagella-associated protein 97 n=1 Tax=Pristis pectinata TaxID=685728 RepID=UPI00223E4E71|nr:cilia- and flagella-associated protein 97 [Pristis pectinata]